MEPRRPPKTNVGTETEKAAFRHDHCKHIQKSKHLWGQRCDQTRVHFQLHRSTCSAPRTPKGTISEVRVHAGAKFGHTGCWSIAKCSQSSRRIYTGGFRSWGQRSDEAIKPVYCKSRIFRKHVIFVYFVRGGFRTKIKCMRKALSKSENPHRSATVRKFYAYEKSESLGYENWMCTKYSGFTVDLLTCVDLYVDLHWSACLASRIST